MKIGFGVTIDEIQPEEDVQTYLLRVNGSFDHVCETQDSIGVGRGRNNMKV